MHSEVSDACPMVDILMATYNGETFIRQQIESILCQTYRHFRLIVSDDGSTDGTVDVIKKYCESDRRIHLVDLGGRFGSAAAHFRALLECATSPYVAFCDQDDVWHLDKLKMFMDVVRDREFSDSGTRVPTAVFSDLRVVDSSLHELSSSYFSYMGIDPSRRKPMQVLVQNIATGCALMINRELSELMLLIPIERCSVTMHDHLAALLASLCGHLIYLPKATISYRQHGSNAVGARAFCFTGWMGNRAGNAEGFWRPVAVSRLLLENCRGYLSSRDARALEMFVDMPRIGALRRVIRLFYLAAWKSNRSRRIGQIIYCFSSCECSEV